MQKAVETKLFRSKRGGEPIKTVGRLLGSFGDEFVERKAVTHGESREMQCTAYTYVESALASVNSAHSNGPNCHVAEI